VQILEKDPLPLTQLENVKVPAELQRIVSKSMAKDADERYQSTKDMLIDLRSLRRRLDLDQEIERSRSAPTNRVPSEDEEVAREPASSSPKPATHEQSSNERNPREHSRSSITILGAALGAVVLSIAAVFGINAWRSSRVGVMPPSGSLPIFERTLNYWMTVQKFRDGKPYKEPFDLPAEINFETDYQVRLNVSSPQGGYLYVLNEGPIADKSLQILFPSSTANSGSALLPQQKPVQIPEQSWFKFDSEQGAETLWIVFSSNAIPELEALKIFTNQTDQGVINNSALNRAAKLFIQANSTTMPRVEKSDSLRQTSIRSSASILVYAVKLAHN
jgi:serine/threonine protein kinase